jgi:transcriptional regulator with XRE-family HTH domain
MSTQDTPDYVSTREAFLLERGKRITRYLEKRKLQQKDFASRLGVSKTHVSNLISGKRIGSATFLARIEELTNHRLKMRDMVPPT